MSLANKIKLILLKVQQNSSCHQKHLKILENYYNEVPFEAFIEEFFKLLIHIFCMDMAPRNPYIERTLEFLAQFVSLLTKSHESDTNAYEDSPSYPFLTRVVTETLTFHDVIYEQARYYSCRFVTLILQHVGNEIQLDNSVYDTIQEAMLERMMDPKTQIRLQAVMAVVRLQEPSNPECPVIKAYISLSVDANPLIRKEVIKRVAPNSMTIPKISDRIRDVDYQVRIAAFSRCADIGPRLFKIVTRQHILQCGFNDEHSQVRGFFLEYLLPKWLAAYNNNSLEFLSSLKLDADENDIINTEEITKQVIEVILSTSSIKDITDALPINYEKLILPDDLSSEVVIYWSTVTRFLRNSEETEEYLDKILPELTPFCHYIQRVIDTMSSKTMEEWEYIECQYMLYNLFDMAEQYDLSDEVGRRTFYKLIMSVLQNHKIQFKLMKKLIGVIDKLISNVDTLTNEICQIISDIREPLVDKPPTHCEQRNINFQVAELKVKINILQGEIEDALDNQDFQKASLLKNEVTDYRKKLDELSAQNQTVKVKISKDDPDTMCRCLDLLGALMELQRVNILSPSLATCKTEFLLPLLSSNNVDINWRVLKCVALYCVIDKSVAEEYTKILCIPIITFRATPNYNKFALIQSVRAICDLIRIYGSKLFDNGEENSSSTLHNTTRRKLYRNEAFTDVALTNHDRMDIETIIEIMLDMLDDEHEDIRETAIIALSKLILNNAFPVNSSLMCRIILKWFNPLEKTVDKTQKKLGYLISQYTQLIKGAREVIEKAVVPIVSIITTAPRTSPLADVDIENVLKFLSAITNSTGTTDIVHVHINLAHTLCSKIASKPKDPIVPHLSKMLLYLDVVSENKAAIRELITQTELLLEEQEDGVDKGSRKKLNKFIGNLKTVIKDPNENEEGSELLLTENIEISNQGTAIIEIEQIQVRNITDSSEAQDSCTENNNIDNGLKTDKNNQTRLCRTIDQNDGHCDIDSVVSSLSPGNVEKTPPSRQDTAAAAISPGRDSRNTRNSRRINSTAKNKRRKINLEEESTDKEPQNGKRSSGGANYDQSRTTNKGKDGKKGKPKGNHDVTDPDIHTASTEAEGDSRMVLRKSTGQKRPWLPTDTEKKDKLKDRNNSARPMSSTISPNGRRPVSSTIHLNGTGKSNSTDKIKNKELQNEKRTRRGNHATNKGQSTKKRKTKSDHIVPDPNIDTTTDGERGRMVLRKSTGQKRPWTPTDTEKENELKDKIKDRNNSGRPMSVKPNGTGKSNSTDKIKNKELQNEKRTRRGNHATNNGQSTKKRKTKSNNVPDPNIDTTTTDGEGGRMVLRRSKGQKRPWIPTDVEKENELKDNTINSGRRSNRPGKFNGFESVSSRNNSSSTKGVNGVKRKKPRK